MVEADDAGKGTTQTAHNPESDNKLNDYEQMGELGRGAYGCVYRGRHRATGKEYAIKKTHIDNRNDGIPSTTIREIAILMELEHRNIVHMEDTVMMDNDIYFIQEYCNTDLAKFLGQMDDSQRLPPSFIKNFLKQILEGVAYCHSQRIIHRDLKPANILLAGPQNELIKLADFGLARAFSIPIKPYTKCVVTLYYRSPELLLEMNEYATPVDIWSVGCIFAELAINQILFKGDNETNQLATIFRLMGRPTEQSWPGITQNQKFSAIQWPDYGTFDLRDLIKPEQIDDQGLDLLKKMLEYEPARRITAKQALQHPYFQN